MSTEQAMGTPVCPPFARMVIRDAFGVVADLFFQRFLKGSEIHVNLFFGSETC